MGRLGRFFKKIGNSIKNVVKKVGRFGGKVLKKAVVVSKKVLPILSLAPGVVGNVARKANTVLNLADNAINQLPEGKIKNKMQSISGAASTKVAETSSKAADLAERAKTIGEKAGRVINAGQTIANGVKTMI